MIVVCVLVLLFVDRFVRRPVARLERGVERIAAGDYTTDIPVTSRDELGRLASGVNSMREQIAGYIRHIDGSVGRLQEVSRALTTTTGGIEQLQDAVLGAADAIAGGSASATMYTKRGTEILRMRSRGPEMPDMVDLMSADELGAGRTVPVSKQAAGPRSRCRCSIQEALTGVLVVAAERPVAESDERALITLANNAAVAIENTRTLEQEREAVRRLSEINQLKSDFLDTAQHELRTPVLAIQGQIELLNVAWDKWDDATKLDIVRDIDISVKLLGETVENVVDFALVNSDTIDVRMAPVDVQGAIRDAANDVRRHFKDGLPVELVIDVRGTPVVNADPFRLRQVLRALIDNAVKFTPEGGHVKVTARREKGVGRVPDRGDRRRHRHQRRGDPATVRPLLSGGQQPHAPPRRHGHGPCARAPAVRRAHRDGEGTQRRERRQHVHDPLAARRRDNPSLQTAALIFEPVPTAI